MEKLLILRKGTVGNLQISETYWSINFLNTNWHHRATYLEVFYRQRFLKNALKFTRAHVLGSLFWIKLQTSLGLQLYEFDEIFKNREFDEFDEILTKNTSGGCFWTLVISSHLSINSEAIPLSQINSQDNWRKW